MMRNTAKHPFFLRSGGNYGRRANAEGDLDWVFLQRLTQVGGEWIAHYITQGGYGEQKTMPAREFHAKYRRIE